MGFQHAQHVAKFLPPRILRRFDIDEDADHLETVACGVFSQQLALGWNRVAFPLLLAARNSCVHESLHTRPPVHFYFGSWDPFLLPLDFAQRAWAAMRAISRLRSGGRPACRF